MSLFVGSRRDVTDAAALIAAFGTAATQEAAARADRSRSLGNHLHFCRWRQVGRLIAVLSGEEATGTIH